MKPRLKPLREQVIVITGASSGIGLTTARRAAREGARVVLTSRNEDALRDVRDEIRAGGGQAEYAVTDVADQQQLAEVARTAERAFGGFDTWVNNAGAAIYSMLADTPIDDMRRVFETNFWGMVHGSLLATEHFRGRPGGGKLITVGSVLSDFSVPEQGIYAASKHAVKGFTNALRMELMHAKAPVSVTLIKPSAIATPYKDHARNYLDAPARVPPPVYAPDVVADAVLYAAQHHVRELTVGSAGAQMTLLARLMPGVADRLYAAVSAPLQRDLREGERIVQPGNLYEPQQDGEERSDLRFVREHSLYTAAQTHPKTTAALALLAGLGLAGAVAAAQRRSA